MNFIEAMQCCISGFFVQRTGWNSREYYISYNTYTNKFEYRYIDDDDFMCPLEEKCMDSESLTASDWIIIS